MSHLCHWPGCKREVPPKLWGCAEHWRTLPHDLRTRIWRAYEPGQEITKTPSLEYLAVAAEVQEWIRREFGAQGERHDPGRWERLKRWVRDRDAARARRRELDAKAESDDIARRLEAQGDAPKN